MRPGLEGGPRQVTGQDVVASVAAIVIRVRPALPEGLAVVFRDGRGLVRGADREFAQLTRRLAVGQ